MGADERASQDDAPETAPDPTEPQDAVTAQAQDPAAAPAKISRRRLIGVDVLIGVTTLLLVVGIFATWANRLLFSPDNWSNTSTQLLQNENVRSTTANYIVDQLYANVNVAGLIKQGLPTQLQGLAAPAAGALRNAAVQGAELALTRPRVQELWARANRAADQTFVDIVNGRKGTVGVNQGAVTLDLGSILNNIASRLGLPSDLASKLPPNIATLTIFKAKELKYVQNGGKAIKGLALWLTILVPLLYILALFLAKGHRRRTLMTIGFAGIIAGVLVILARSILQGAVTSSLTHDASLQATIHDVYGIATSIGPTRAYSASGDRSVPARAGRRDVRDRAGAAGSSVHLEPDPRDRHADRDSHIHRARAVRHVSPDRTNRPRIPRGPFGGGDARNPHPGGEHARTTSRLARLIDSDRTHDGRAAEAAGRPARPRSDHPRRIPIRQSEAARCLDTSDPRSRSRCPWSCSPPAAAAASPLTAPR